MHILLAVFALVMILLLLRLKAKNTQENPDNFHISIHRNSEERTLPAHKSLTTSHFIIHFEVTCNASQLGSAAATPPEQDENHAFWRSDLS